MSDTQIELPNEEQENSVPGQFACMLAKGIAWVLFFVAIVFGFKFIGPFLKAAVNGPSSLTAVNSVYGYLFISCFSAAVILFVLIAICENLMLMNKK